MIRREAQRGFIARGVQPRDAARRKNAYVDADAVIKRLGQMLVRAKTVANKPR